MHRNKTRTWKAKALSLIETLDPQHYLLLIVPWRLGKGSDAWAPPQIQPACAGIRGHFQVAPSARLIGDRKQTLYSRHFPLGLIWAPGYPLLLLHKESLLPLRTSILVRLLGSFSFSVILSFPKHNMETGFQRPTDQQVRSSLTHMFLPPTGAQVPFQGAHCPCHHPACC